MSQRFTYAGLGIALAAGSLVALAAATPAAAGVGWDPGISNSADWSYGVDNGVGLLADDGGGLDPLFDPLFGVGTGLGNFVTTPGQVHRNGGLSLRSSPRHNSPLVRIAQNGETVRIFCQTTGEPVNGDSTWYLIDGAGTWSWGPARFIDSFEPPLQC